MSGVGSVIAVDVGGTTIKGGILDRDGQLIGRRSWRTPSDRGQAGVVETVLEAIDELRCSAIGAVAVGLVVPGLVDDHAGVALYSENIGWRDVPFRELVKEQTRLPVGFGHDVRAGGLAERTLGAARGSADHLFLPIGTGISGAIVVAGQPVESMYAGEIGHIDVRSGEICACGASGCLEAISSGTSIAKRYNRTTGAAVVGAREVLDLIAEGDKAAATVWDDAVGALAQALSTYISLLAPELIVIGGGVSSAGRALLDPLVSQLRRLLVWQREPRIVTAHFGADSACIGAGLLGRRATSSTK